MKHDVIANVGKSFLNWFIGKFSYPCIRTLVLNFDWTLKSSKIFFKASHAQTLSQVFDPEMGPVCIVNKQTLTNEQTP